MSYFNGQRIDDDFQQQEPVKQERTFSLQDMVECYERAYSDAGYEDQGLEWSKTEYFREKGIDITQQV